MATELHVFVLLPVQVMDYVLLLIFSSLKDTLFQVCVASFAMANINYAQLWSSETKQKLQTSLSLDVHFTVYANYLPMKALLT